MKEFHCVGGTMTREERRAHWRGVIDEQAASGKSIRMYCRDGRIKSDLFYSWRRRLREEPSLAGGFVELAINRPISSGTSINIRLNGNLCIEVNSGFDPVTLRAVVETLSNLHRCSA